MAFIDPSTTKLAPRTKKSDGAYPEVNPPASRTRGYSTVLSRFMQEDPEGYVDGPNKYQAELSNPVTLLDPTGLQATQPGTQPATQPTNSVTVDLNINTGSKNKDKPWIGAVWTLYTHNDPGSPGFVQIGLPAVKSSVSGCSIKFDISIKFRIQIRNLKDRINIKNVNGQRVLTPAGEQIYGHEQLHEQDYTLTLTALVNGIVSGIAPPTSLDDAKKKAEDGERQLRKAIDAWRAARLPEVIPDITHRGPGQPKEGVGADPQGAPGPYESEE